jgi:Na+-driven multidrug efflux pump
MQFVYVMFGGMSAGVAILVGTRLGAGQFKEARTNSRRLMFLGSVIGAILMVVALLISGPLPEFFNVSDQIKATATLLIRLQTLFFIPQLLYTIIFFVLRAVVISSQPSDSMLYIHWLVPIPIAVVLATVIPRFTPITIVAAYMISQFVLNAKLMAAFKYYRKEHWLQNLTVDHEEPLPVAEGAV